MPSPSGAQLEIIPGPTPGTYTLGYVLSRKPFRDQRFGPSLQFREAQWLLNNERALAMKDRREGVVT